MNENSIMHEKEELPDFNKDPRIDFPDSDDAYSDELFEIAMRVFEFIEIADNDFAVFDKRGRNI